jgi:4-amino-4-deoxy-L-arabinose transferase-like glycosyltransferase
MKVFGINEISAEYVSLLFGVLMIPLLYIMGALIFDRRAGFLAAFLTWIDPISSICSQKIWMETTLSFFTVLATFFFIYGVKKGRSIFFIIGGCACGAAALTKYTGILPMLIIIFYALTYERQLFKEKEFLIGLAMPFVLLWPWLGWNFTVYGFQDFILRDEPHFANLIHSVDIKLVFAVGFLIISISLLLRKIIKNIRNKFKRPDKDRQVEDLNKEDCYSQNAVAFILGVIFLIVLSKYIVLSLDFSYLPKISWGNFGFRDDNTPFFYFQQLLKFSPLFFFSYLALFLPGADDDEGTVMVRLSAILMMAFFIFYRNYQSRYILPVVPLLILLSSGYMIRLFNKIETRPLTLPVRLVRLMMAGLISWGILKTYYVNSVISFPNDLCYF